MKTFTDKKIRRDPLAETIRACFANGVLEPLERLDVPEGEVLTVTIICLPLGEAGGGLERSPGGWKGVIDAEELKRNISWCRSLGYDIRTIQKLPGHKDIRMSLRYENLPTEFDREAVEGLERILGNTVPLSCRSQTV